MKRNNKEKGGKREKVKKNKKRERTNEGENEKQKKKGKIEKTRTKKGGQQKQKEREKETKTKKTKKAYDRGCTFRLTTSIFRTTRVVNRPRSFGNGSRRAPRPCDFSSGSSFINPRNSFWKRS